MKKDDHRFHRDRKQQIENQSRQNEAFYRWDDSKPIYIPKKKKKK